MTDTVEYVQANRKTYPILFSMAMDYLPIQASAVPCERIFSSSAETDTKKRNRITPILMEALQMLKYHYKKHRLDFSHETALNQWEVMDDPEGPLDAERTGLQGEEVREAIDKLIKDMDDEEFAIAELM